MQFGATCTDDGVEFRVWAPTRRRIDLYLAHDGHVTRVPLHDTGGGRFFGRAAAAAGDRYVYCVDGEGPYPDPASRFQPFGVHGPSEIVDPRAYHWSDHAWTSLPLTDAVVYELHVGTFTPSGTFTAVRERLPYLQDLGVTAIELMPLGDFPGARNWGYDVAALFAPARCYGPPDDLRRLVDAAHRHGLAMLLDVVYNHLGPDGAFQPVFNPHYFSRRHRTIWGPGINLDGPHSQATRELLIANAIYWLSEFHFDGLRLDATHALIDDSGQHLLAELVQRVQGALAPRSVLLIAEDERNEARLLRPPTAGGYALDAVWSDDFHHHVRRLATGDDESYFANFSGSLADLASTIEHGWFYRGQRQSSSGSPRGSDPSGLTPPQFVLCLQNHDQIGNRAFGDRLHHAIDPALYRALTVLLLSLPQTPLLFMGQEWSADTPFLFFTDHRQPLGELVSAGRRREFNAFRAFTDAHLRDRIPDPQDIGTFSQSILDWSELEQPRHAAIHRLYRRCLRLRAEDSKRFGFDTGHACGSVGSAAIALLRRTTTEALLTLVNVRETNATLDIAMWCSRFVPENLRWTVQLDSEHPEFSQDPRPPAVVAAPYPVVTWSRPGAVILRGS